MDTRTDEQSWSLGEYFVDSARKNWCRRCICDSTGKKLNYGQTLISAVAMAEQLEKVTVGQGKIGLLLPPSVAGALANLAVTLLGKVSVNLNYSSGEGVINSAIEQCGLKTIISSRSFAERLANFENIKGIIFLEDIKAKINFISKIKAYLKVRFMPIQILANAQKSHGDDMVTVIFSSGSGGRPKGVMLSHKNIYSNTQAIRKVIWLKPEDNLCVVLPFFHSFGFTCGLWLPLFGGASASYAFSPLDYKMISQIADKNRATILFASPTFLLNFTRRVEPKAFGNLRLVVAGAEKMRKPTADAFEEKFGIRPLEGYGATELSPVVSLNLTDELSTGLHKVGHKEGTVGLALPGIGVKIVSPQAGKDLPAGQSGLLMVKGPNVMLGYLDNPEETAKVLKDGWYNTGDIASIDEDGFLTIQGRLSRFSKIAGEMIPHIGVEQAYLNALGIDEQVVAVTSVPDPKKGEELVVLYMEQAGDADKLHEILSKSSLPNIWKPRRDNYIRIESMPLLGSGKLDVLQLQKIASIAKGTKSNKDNSALSEI